MVTLTFQQPPHHNGVFEASSRMLIGIVSEQAATFVLWDVSDNNVDACEIFTGIEDWASDWDQLLQKSALLSWKHLQTRILWDMPRYMPIPAGLFQPASAQEQVALVHGPAPVAIHHGADVLGSREMVVYWEVPASLQKIMARHFEYWQASSMASVLAGLVPQLDGVPFTAHVVLTAGCTWLVLANHDKPLWIHRLPGQQAPEIVYALLNACALHGVAHEDVYVFTAGPLEPSSNLYTALHEYFTIAAWPELQGASPAERGQAYFTYLNTWINPRVR